MKTILFQGDSITDANRGNGLGTGYPLLVSSKLGFENPNDYTLTLQNSRSPKRMLRNINIPNPQNNVCINGKILK